VLMAGRQRVDGDDARHLFLNDVTLVGCVMGELFLCFCGLFLLLLLLLPELLDPLQLLLDRCCLDGNYISNLSRDNGLVINISFELSPICAISNSVWFG